LRELKQSLRVRVSLIERSVLVDFALEARLFLGQLPGFAVVAPKFGLLREIVEFGDAALFDRQVKATPEGNRVFLSLWPAGHGSHEVRAWPEF